MSKFEGVKDLVVQIPETNAHQVLSLVASLAGLNSEQLRHFASLSHSTGRNGNLHWISKAALRRFEFIGRRPAGNRLINLEFVSVERPTPEDVYNISILDGLPSPMATRVKQELVGTFNVI